MEHRSTLRLDAGRVSLFLTLPVIVLLLASILQDLAIFGGMIDAGQKVWLLDVDAEESLYTWWSSLLLFLASALLFAIAMAHRPGDVLRKHWGFLGAIFLVLSADEALSFHERASAMLSGALNTGGVFFFAWTIPAIILLLAGLVLYLPFLRALPPKERGLLLLSAAIFVSGAVGMEMLAGSQVEQNGFDTLQYRLMANLEEGLEGFGVCLFLYGLLRLAKGLSLSIGRNPAPTLAASSFRLKGSRVH